MVTSTVSDQGHTTVPASVRKALKAPPGTVLAWANNGSRPEVVAVVKAQAREHTRIDYETFIKDWKGSPAVPDRLLKLRRSKKL